MSGWKDNTTQIVRKEPLGMAEPVHRMPPNGATSQQSFRSIPKSSIQQVKEICLYYVSKCSGKYSHNKVAARYIHQMAEEIMFQLAGVANEIKMNRGEPEVFQTLLEEWNEHFPPSLGAIGSPKAIAALLANQAKEIQHLKDELQTERVKRENDVSAVLRSMDVQLHSYRATVMNDRRQQRVLFNQEISNLEEQMKEMQTSFEEEKKTMNDGYHQEYRRVEGHYENLLKQSQKNLEDAIKANERTVNRIKEKKNHRIHFLKEKMKDMKIRITELKQQYNVLAMILNEESESTSDESDDDDFLEKSEESDDDYDSEDESVTEVGSLLGIDFEKRKTEKEERKKKREEERDLKIASMAVDASAPRRGSFYGGDNTPGSDNIASNTAAEEIRQLKDINIAALANIKRLEKKLARADKKNAELTEEIAYLRKTIEDLIAERAVHMKHLKDLEELNETLRRAVSVDLETVDLSKFDKNIDARGLLSQMLCHTPHFLDRPDRGGPNKVEKRMSAYKTSGHF